MSENVSTSQIAPDLLQILCCPETHQKLQLAPASLIEKLNSQIFAGSLLNRGGKPVAESMAGGLLRDDGKFLYPIRRNLPIMLVDEAIPLTN